MICSSQLTEGTQTMRALLAAALLVLVVPVAAQEPVLEVSLGGDTRRFTRDALLARPDVVTVEVAKDITYGRPMTYRAVPLATLLAGLLTPSDNDVVETVAADGFVAHLPFDLVNNTDPAKAIAWLAIEPPEKPWP